MGGCSRRILLCEGGVHRSLYFLSVGKDGSLYFGSGTPYSRLGVFSGAAPRPGALRYDDSSLEMFSARGQSKHSLHPSGALLGPAIMGRRARSHQIAPIASYDSVFPLVGVKPMTPLAYARVDARPRDVVFHWRKLDYLPFAFVVLAVLKARDPAVFVPRHLPADRVHIIGFALGGYVFSIGFYTNRATFRGWPGEQSEVIARTTEGPARLMPAAFRQMP